MIDTEVLESIGADAAARLTDAYHRMTANGSPPHEVERVLTDLLTSGRAAAMVDGEAMALRQLEELGVTVDRSNLRVRLDRSAFREAAERAAAERQRYAAAVATILSDPDSAVMRLGRLALSEAIEAARGRTTQLMRASREVDGWVRQLDSDPCELCQWWWRNGRIWPADHEMPVHKGCACAQSWTRISSLSIRMVGEQGRQQSEERREAGTLEERRAMNVGDYSSRSVRGNSDT